MYVDLISLILTIWQCKHFSDIQKINGIGISSA